MTSSRLATSRTGSRAVFLLGDSSHNDVTVGHDAGRFLAFKNRRRTDVFVFINRAASETSVSGVTQHGLSVMTSSTLVHPWFLL